ncbi:HDIG domain-containing protein [Desulfuromonas carbonis]|uniref:HD family phosphohydrolase n=1 Tax=Desulfuromonas sp. DDH964 TaxID=1823759 RepID=UPI00078B79FA|nr:HDIG domain-containing metalloprotein [Desulfuromonas sp. DDH964]AMV72689.1 membrane-associated metal-dependent phosphohydrolase, HDc domain-containing [Desulfuromonas sp. DDH964]
MTKAERKPESSKRKGRFAPELPGPPLQERTRRQLLLIFLAVVLTIIIIPKGGLVPDYYEPGDIVSRDIKAPKDLLIPDQPLTEKKRVEAEAAVLPLYDYDPAVGREIADQLVQALRQSRREPPPGSESESLRKEIEATLGVPLTEADLAGLRKIPEGDAFYTQLGTVVARALGGRIVGNLQLFQGEKERGVLVRDLTSQQESKLEDISSVIGLGGAQDRIGEGLRQLKELSRGEREFLDGLLRRLVHPNLTFNKNETEARRAAARAAVAPVLFQVKKGEMIAREGERVTSEQISKLRALRESGSDSSTLRTGAGMLLVTLLLIFITHRFAKLNVRKYRPATRDLLFLVTAFLGLFVLIKLAIFISTALESAFPYIDSSSYFYLFPFAVGAMLVRIVLNSEVALIFILLSTTLLGVLFGNSLFITLYAMSGSLVGAHWVRQCKERTSLYRAGFRVAIVNALMILGLQLLAGRGFDTQLLYKIGFGLGGGFLCAVIVTGLIPLVEHLFKYTTDIKLLELANMNTPVLRELMVQAPGTYHHSIIVGNLVEAAAEEINANPLLARVAAYYHDVGKIRKPLYFIENLGGQENRHDKLAPSMSALVLMAHLKDGVEMARECKLGEPLINIIREHHGTSLIKFFYDKAKNKSDPDVQQVDERDYRYPGPKPQTREAALIMLADAVEAASRTLTDPTPARIRGMVQKIINNIFIDGQLDECELTLKDLDNIAKSFNRILSGIFHHRVDYPEPAYKEREKDPSKRKNGEDSNREPAKEAKDKETATAKGSTEDLKRLGMS